jgi:hypothetical protein
MSLYFDGFLAFDLKPDTPQQIIDTLFYMTRTDDYEFMDIPHHRLFTSDPDWRDFLRAGEGDYEMAPGITSSGLKKIIEGYGDGTIFKEYYTLSFRRTMHDDVEFYVLWWDFLDWIAPYSSTNGFVGYYRETFDLYPTLIYFKNGTIFSYEIKASPQNLEVRWEDVADN